MKPDKAIELEERLLAMAKIVEAQQAEIDALKAATAPKPAQAPFVPGPRGPTTTELALALLTKTPHSPELMQSYREAAPEAEMRGIRSERHATEPVSQARLPSDAKPPAADEPEVNRSGWREARPIAKWRL